MIAKERVLNNKLIAAIENLACAVRDASSQHQTNAILEKLAQMETRIMSAISTFLASQKAYNEQQAAAIHSLVTAVTGVTEDVTTLNDKITELQNSSGGVTPEDQVLIDELQASGAALVAKLQAASDALAAVDAATPPKVPAVTPA